MKTAAIIICVLLAVAAVVFLGTRTKRQEINSFWDVVRNPDAMSDLDQFHKEVEDAAASLSGSGTEIAQLVDDYVFAADSARDSWTELRILAKLGNQTYPRALEILRDPALKECLTGLAQHDNSLLEGPINRLCEIFDQDAPPPKEAAMLLAPFLQSNSDEIRKSVALIIGSIASPDSFAELRRALTDKEEYVRSYALMGIQRAISGDRIEESSRNEFFALVAGMWPADTGFTVCDSIPLILLGLDRDRAIPHLLNDELLTVRFPPVWRILEAFNEKSVEVPRSRILAIIAEANQEPLEYPMDNVLEQALPLLSAHRNDEDLPMFELFLDHENEDVSRGATVALCRFHRYDHLIRNPWDVVEKNGWDALTVTEKYICAIEELNAEVNNGGFAQYYFNSSGDHWEHAQKGLTAMGAKQRHQLMSATVNKFGDSMPSVDRDARASQLSKIVHSNEDPFHEQDGAWYKIEDENLDRLMFKYNLANLDGRDRGLLEQNDAR